MKISVGVSNHHIHLTEDDYKILFGNDILKIRNMLKQPGQFASCEKVTIIGPKGKIENMTIVGPFRNYTQVELTKYDCYKLELNAPVRDSGDLDGACLVTIVGPKGKIQRNSAIIANRHIHVDKNILQEKNLIGVKEVSIKVNGEKGGILEHVSLKESSNAYFELHLDLDDANAFLLQNNDEVEIII